MTFRKIAAAGAALAVAASPAVYAGANARTAAPAQGESELAGGGALYAVLAIAVVAAFTAITIAAEDDDEPVSA
ncbi:hypothetical protein [Qipengyuania sp.]|uniref:hypothetical protein n=1 Tax=Qipengyuania sp. TaxID=2004515 RepID=UPI0035C7F45B